jgi:hypothetical protein
VTEPTLKAIQERGVVKQTVMCIPVGNIRVNVTPFFFAKTILFCYHSYISNWGMTKTKKFWDGPEKLKFQSLNFTKIDGLRLYASEKILQKKLFHLCIGNPIKVSSYGWLSSVVPYVRLS